MDNDKIIEKLTELSTKIDVQDKDIHILYKKCEELSQSSNASDVNTQKIFLMIENMSKQMNEMNTVLKDLSSKPAKNWNMVITTIITGVVTGVVAYIFGRITGK